MSTDTNNQPVVAVKDLTETVTIKRVGYTTTKEGVDLVILHVTPTKELKDKEGAKLVRFKMNKKVFEQRAKENDMPASIFAMLIIGGTYSYTYRPVKAGDAFISGEGTYTVDHNAKVSDAITLSAAAQTKNTDMALSAFYGAKFGAQSAIAQSVAIPVSSAKIDDGSDIDA